MPLTRRMPDPLSIEERDRILAWMRQSFDVRVWAYFTFMFFTGMRPEEAIARRWGDIDWARRQILVQRVRTFKGSEWGDTKTYSERVGDLVEPALDALHAMKLLTMAQHKSRETQDDIFDRCLRDLSKRKRVEVRVCRARPSPAAPRRCCR